MTAALSLLPDLPAVSPAEQTKADLVSMLQLAVDRSARSLQTALGPSEMAHPCQRRLAFAFLGVPEVARKHPRLPSFIGTATHAGLEQAALAANLRLGRERYLTELRVPVWQAAEPNCDPVLAGSCDLFDQDTGTVIDHKILGDGSFKKYRLHGPPQVYRGQVQLYGAGAVNLGLDVKRVQIAMWPKSGTEHGLVVYDVAFDPAVSEWLRDRWYRLIVLIDVLRAEEDPGQVGRFIPAAPSEEACRFCPWFRPEPDDSGLSCQGTAAPAATR